MSAKEQIIDAAQTYGWRVSDMADVAVVNCKRKNTIIAVTFDRTDHVRWCYLHRNGWPAGVRVKGGTEAVILKLKTYGSN